MKKIVVGLLMLFLALGCANVSKIYHHPTASNEQREQDYQDCRAETERTIGLAHGDPARKAQQLSVIRRCMERKGYTFSKSK